MFACATSDFAQTPTNDPTTWTLQWKDDFRYLSKTFNGTQYAIGEWSVRHNDDHYGEPQVYIQNNATTNGTNGLVLTAQKSNYYCPTCTSATSSPFYSCKGNGATNSYPNHQYISGEIVLDSRASGPMPRYGYVEGYIQITRDVYGLFPAFWLFRSACTCTAPDAVCNASFCPACNPPGFNYDYDEIDIFEMTPGDASPLGIQNKNIMTSSLHKCSGEPADLNGQISTINDYTLWHKYGVEWSPSKIIYYIDDVAVRISPNPDYPTNPNGAISQNLLIILNVALSPFVGLHNGLTYFGPCGYNNADYFSSTHSGGYSPADLNTNPVSMNVQYVSYYTLKQTCSTPYTINNTTALNNYDHHVKSNISITSGSGATTSSSSPKSLRATDYIQVDDLTVPLGTELYLDVNPCE